MSILVKCPKGHALKVEDKFAGRQGRCPKCGTTVVVPAPSSPLLDEDAILELLDSPQSGPTSSSSVNGTSTHDEGPESESRGRTPSIDQALKFCPHCHREVSATLHLCPHCRHYFSDPREFTREAAHHCAECGTERIPGDERCSVCGVEFARVG